MERRAYVVASLVVVSTTCWSQWNQNGNGDWWLSPTPIAPRSVNVGDGTTLNLATLNVRGDQLPVFDQFVGTSLCTFRTDVPNGNNQNWSMVRGTLEIGRLWHTNPGNAFHIQARQADGNLLLENSATDGIRINSNGNAAVPLNGYTLDRTGYVAIGSSNAWNFLLTPNGPWSRLHLVHPDQGTAPNFAFRPQMRNGLIASGNSDLAYLGQWYDRGQNGTGAEVDDHSNLVIASSDDALPVGLGHHWDHISFRFMGDMSGVQGSASGVEGLEMMRIRPYRATTNDPIEGFVGIGDFLAASTGPEERLDMASVCIT